MEANLSSRALSVALRAVWRQLKYYEAVLATDISESDAYDAGEYWSELNETFGVLADAYDAIRVDGVDQSVDELIENPFPTLD